jgi:Transmembrane domain of unknown function (DUF3566)
VASSAGAGGKPASTIESAEVTVRTPPASPPPGGPGSTTPGRPMPTTPAAKPDGGSARAAASTGTVRPSPLSVTGSHPVVTPSSPPVIARVAVGGGAATTTLTRPGGAGAVGAARVSDAMRTARATVAGAASRGPRRARLHVKRIDPWSVMKFSFAVSLVLFVMAIVATSVLYLALDAMGVFASINKALSDMVGGGGGTGTATFKITAKGVIGASVLLGAVNMVLFTALMTLGAFVYNVCADLVGGVEVTLSEKD